MKAEGEARGRAGREKKSSARDRRAVERGEDRAGSSPVIEATV